MTEEKLTPIIEALETLSKETDVNPKDIVDLLIGFCWDDEDAFYIKKQIYGKNDD